MVDVAELDGNGFVYCRCGQRHWGLHGAAGLLLERQGRVLLQLRATWVHQGGTWSTPGGAVDSHEQVREAALREAVEELGIETEQVEVLDEFVAVDHLDWRYHVVGGRLSSEALPRAANSESDEVGWFTPEELVRLPLHPGFAAGWDDTWQRLGPLFEHG